MPRIRLTIRRRIAVAFFMMAAVTVTVGVLAILEGRRADQLVSHTYDRILMSNNFVRAAADDFASLQASLLRGMVFRSGRRDDADSRLAALQTSFETDLSTAAEAADLPAITDSVTVLRAQEAEWIALARGLGPHPGGAEWTALDRKAREVEAGVEALVKQVSGEGARSRQSDQAQIAHDSTVAMAAVGSGVGLLTVVALMLWRSISRPVGQAARFAGEIASGGLDGKTPRAPRDEIGDLIEAMVAMRGNIATMMAEQVILREQSQARIAEALEGSQDGVVVADARGHIQVINNRALNCLGLGRADMNGVVALRDLGAKVLVRAPERLDLLRLEGPGPEVDEHPLPDGRWVQASRYRTSEGGLVALFVDISAVKDQQDRLADANRTLDAALANMSQGLCLFDAANRLKLANARVRELFDLPEHVLPPGTSYETLVRHVLGRVGAGEAEIERLLRYETAMSRHQRGVSRSLTLGSRTIAVVQRRLADGGWIATYEDITERKRADAQIAFMATHDALTRLPNRTMLATRVEEAIARARRGVPFAVHCVDLDLFKQVNDRLGHAVGDQLLLAVTDRLLTCVRSLDTVARLGGDEFAILQCDADSPEHVALLAERIVGAVSAPYVIEGHDISIGASVGIAMAPHDGMSHGLLLKSADAALYKAKDEGRRTWRFFEPSMDESLQARHAMEADLRRAVVNGEFEVHFQPLLDLSRGHICAMEALLRWHHPTKGLVPPDRFIPVAEDAGLIGEIGRWVMRAACQEATRWMPGVSVAVNVSTLQLRDPGFTAMVSDALQASGLSPSRLEIEITESVFMANTAKIMPILTALRATGVRFAMDDFGTGYSSLSTLRAFSFDKIKIDRSFVRDLSAAEAAGQIIRTIVALGRSLGMRITAEGVETHSQLDFLRQAGCDEIQGYLLGRPMPPRDVLAWMAGDTARTRLELAA